MIIFVVTSKSVLSSVDLGLRIAFLILIWRELRYGSELWSLALIHPVAIPGMDGISITIYAIS